MRPLRRLGVSFHQGRSRDAVVAQRRTLVIFTMGAKRSLAARLKALKKGYWLMSAISSLADIRNCKALSIGLSIQYEWYLHRISRWARSKFHPSQRRLGLSPPRVQLVWRKECLLLHSIRISLVQKMGIILRYLTPL